MKKFLTLLISLMLVLTMGAVFTACGDNPDDPPDSGYEVTEEQFESAINFEGVNSVKVSLVIQEDGETDTHIIWFDGAKAKNDITYGDDNELYYVEYKGSAGDIYSCVDGVWYKMAMSETQVSYQTKLSDYKDIIFFMPFSDFTFEDNTYKVTYAGTEISVKFQDGRLISVDMVSAAGSTCNYTFSDYNNTTVTLPADFVDLTGGSGGGAGSGSGESGLAEYIDIENVTISVMASREYYGELEPVVDTYGWKIDDERWTFDGPNFQAPGGGVGVQVYCDGTNCYINGSDTPNAEGEAYFDVLTELLTFIANNQNKFSEVVEDVFYVDSIDFYTIATYYEVFITIQDDVISSISYTVNDTYNQVNTPGYYTEDIVYTFSNYGTTVVNGDYNPGGEPTAWADYFSFENVTITAVDEDKYYYQGDLVREDYSVSTWKLDDEKWSYRCESDDYNIYAIYDGEECLIDNTPYADVSMAKVMFVENSILGFLDDMIYGEEMFVETGDNEYTLEMENDGMIKTCVVTFANGYVSSIVYTIVGEDGDGYGGELKSTYTFTAIDSTVVE